MAAHSTARLRLWTALVALLPCALADGADGVTPDAQLVLSSGESADIFASLASFGPLPSEYPGTSYHLYLPSDPLGCTRLASPPQIPSEPTALSIALVGRGNCSFTAKAFNVQAAGYAALIVYDSIQGAYPAAALAAANASGGNTSALVANSCSYFCPAGSGSVVAADVTVAGALAGFPGQCGSGCASGACLLTSAPPVDAAGSRQVCCLVSDYMAMGGSGAAFSSAIRIPAVFVTYAEGLALLRAVSPLQRRLAPSEGVAYAQADAAASARFDAAGRPADGACAKAGEAEGAYYAPRLTRAGPPRTLLHSLHSSLFATLGAAAATSAASSHPAGEPTAAGAAGALLAASHAVGRAGDLATDSRRLQPVGPLVTLGLRFEPTVDAASALLAIIAVAVVALASWRSAEVERARLREAADRAANPAAAPTPRAQHSMGVPAFSVTVREGLFMLAAAAAVLVSLYLLVRAGFSIIYFVIGVFALGSFQALVLLAFLPGLRALPRGVGKRLESITLLSRVIRGAELRVSAAQALALTLAAGCVATWVLLRHAGWAWLPQDAFGVALCCMFLLQLQLNGLRDACVLLALFFAYDVFMVFLSPYVFGSSVMIDVATAGAPVAVPNWACYCRANPGDVSSCGPGEVMPILLRLPRVSGYQGGYAMLGLGDVVLPGLLLSLCLRFDLALKREGLYGTDALALRRARRRAATLRGASYWQVALIGYGLGIALAMAAVAAFKSGQPALLYLVPCTVVPVLVLASVRGDLPLWWRWRGIDAGMAPDEEGGEEEAGGTGAALTSGHGSAESDGEGQGDVPVVVGAAREHTPAASATVATADAALAAYEAIALHAGTEDTHGTAISPQAAPAAASTGAGSAAPAYSGSSSHAPEDDSEGDTQPLTRGAAVEKQKQGRARGAPTAAGRGRRSGAASRAPRGSTLGDTFGGPGTGGDPEGSEAVTVELSAMPSGSKGADGST